LSEIRQIESKETHSNQYAKVPLPENFPEAITLPLLKNITPAFDEAAAAVTPSHV